MNLYNLLCSVQSKPELKTDESIPFLYELATQGLSKSAKSKPGTRVNSSISANPFLTVSKVALNSAIETNSKLGIFQSESPLNIPDEVGLNIKTPITKRELAEELTKIAARCSVIRSILTVKKTQEALVKSNIPANLNSAFLSAPIMYSQTDDFV